MLREYAVIDFYTKHRLASNRGQCRGTVDVETGEITAVVSYGLTSYHEKYKLNTSDEVNNFPYTVEDEIIIQARKAVDRAKKRWSS